MAAGVRKGGEGECKMVNGEMVIHGQIKKIDRIIIRFDDFRIHSFDIPKFRGYLANKYLDYTLIHNHLSDNKYRYAYPSIQFKIIDGRPVIVGIGDGIAVLKHVFLDIEELEINGKVHQVDEKSIAFDSVDIGQWDKGLDYCFLSPWMALNSDNYKEYRTLQWHEQRRFLETILSRNLKSLSKGLDYFIPDFDQLHVQADLRPVARNFKNIKMICFEGTFSTNFIIPDYLGIGKQTARGFGTVKQRSLSN